jgi:hypothetical protein
LGLPLKDETPITPYVGSLPFVSLGDGTVSIMLLGKEVAIIEGARSKSNAAELLSELMSGLGVHIDY